MSDVLTAVSRPATGGRFWRLVKWTLRVLLVLFLVSFLFAAGLLEVPFRLLLGWAPYLVHVVPQTQVNMELLLCSLGALALGMIGMQWLMSRLRAPQRWPWRWTLTWCAMLVVMFSTSIAAVGIVHQAAWLFRLPVWIEWSGMGTQIKTMMNAKQVVLAARQYASAHDDKFPESCAEMMPEIVTDSRIFWVSVDKNMPLEPLVYAGAGLRDSDHGDWPVVWSPRPSANGQRVIARLDGSAEVIGEEKFQEMLAAFRERLLQPGAAAKTPR